MYTYNVLNQLINFRANESAVLYTYTYDPLGMRSKKSGGVTREYVYDGGLLLFETTLEPNRFAGIVYNYGYNLISSFHNDQNISYRALYVLNARGDVIQQLDPTTYSVLSGYAYDAFGEAERTMSNGTYVDLNPFRYCGEYYDAESGLVYLRARYYNPELGRFINEDPIRDGLNWYVYCGNNPVNFIDPSGKSYAAILYGMESFFANYGPTVIAIIGSLFVGEVASDAIENSGGVSIVVDPEPETPKSNTETVPAQKPDNGSVFDPIEGNPYSNGETLPTDNSDKFSVMENPIEAQNEPTVVSASKKPDIPSKLMENGMVKTPDTNMQEFTRGRDGTYIHNKTKWRFSLDKAGHGGEKGNHWDAAPSGKNSGHRNISRDGRILW